MNPAKAWTIKDSLSLYQVDAWGDRYFTVNEQGHACASPTRTRDQVIDMVTVVEDLRRRGITFPVLLRFQEILHGRVAQLNDAFASAIEEARYQNCYTGVYPIKVNQLHEVVEEVLEAGLKYGMGLECGSKAELVAALAHLESDDTLLICNGYKDEIMLRQILNVQSIGKSVIPVLEKYDEFTRISDLASEMDVVPRFGVRVRLNTGGAGRWSESAGENSKFGMTISELVQLCEQLRENGNTESFVLLHFHIGSQVSNILNISNAVQEISRVYAALYAQGITIRYLDVGGGLGVNYEAAFSGREQDINYSLQEYANAVVFGVRDVCDRSGVPHPVLISESGRAITAHHSVLVVEALGAYRRETVSHTYSHEDKEHRLVHAVANTLAWVSGEDALTVTQLLEAYHDASGMRNEAASMFSLGMLGLQEVARIDQLYWSVCAGITGQLTALETNIPPELAELASRQVDQYLCDFSVFQSLLDHWSIEQRFPIMPMHRLDECPDRSAILVDLTCDSDGKISHYVSGESNKRSLRVHSLQSDHPYFFGIFLVGAYQDILGDAHNLFGRVSEVHIFSDPSEPHGYYIDKHIPGMSVQEMLSLVQYFPKDLERRMNQILKTKIASGDLRARDAVSLLDAYIEMFNEPTYLRGRHRAI